MERNPKEDSAPEQRSHDEEHNLGRVALGDSQMTVSSDVTSTRDRTIRRRKTTLSVEQLSQKARDDVEASNRRLTLTILRNAAREKTPQRNETQPSS